MPQTLGMKVVLGPVWYRSHAAPTSSSSGSVWIRDPIVWYTFPVSSSSTSCSCSTARRPQRQRKRRASRRQAWEGVAAVAWVARKRRGAGEGRRGGLRPCEAVWAPERARARSRGRWWKPAPPAARAWGRGAAPEKDLHAAKSVAHGEPLLNSPRLWLLHALVDLSSHGEGRLGRRRGAALPLEEGCGREEGCRWWMACTRRGIEGESGGSRYLQLHARRPKSWIGAEWFGGGAAGSIGVWQRSALFSRSEALPNTALH
jgi:hypothetical protein